MGTWFRHVDRYSPFLWETSAQPPGRWHGTSEGPAQYLASTPEGAWAEFLRHEEITDVHDLAGISRALWAVEVDDDSEQPRRPSLAADTLLGGLDSYAECQVEARRLREDGATASRAPAAALMPGGASGQSVHEGLVDASSQDGEVICLFGARPALRGHLCVDDGRPPARVLRLVRPLTG